VKWKFIVRKSSTKYIIMLLLFYATISFAARPYHTDDPGTTEVGKFEIEAAADYWHNSTAPGIVFKHGITERMELDIPIGYIAQPEEERSIELLQLYAKFAIIPDLFAATFTSAMGDRVYTINGIIGRAIGDFNLILNLGGVMVGNTNDADLTYGVSGTYTIGTIETGIELGGTQESINWWQIGIKYFFKKWCSLDAGFGGDFKKKINVTSGMVFSFPVSKEKKGK
jgi:hypothetical protein